jgi:N-dimethylarginine dimethylaminohydrolase
MYHDYGDELVIDDTTNGHIDCRFNIVDKARIIYLAMGARPGTMKEGPNPLKERSFEALKIAAEKHGYEIRNFFIEEEKIDEKIKEPDVLSAAQKFDPDFVGGHAINGINFITNNDHLFTSIIGNNEKEYLESKGIKVVEVPLKFTYNGAGLRCVYGEISQTKN